MMAIDPSTRLIGPSNLLPDVLRRFPGLRRIFDRYGLRGCGGPLGPAESVEYFARVHGVQLGKLLEELNTEAHRPCVPLPSGSGAVLDPKLETGNLKLDALADTIYRRFFKAGIVVILTAGAAWGAWLLMRIAAGESFTSVSIHEVNAHGHAQIYGWVGLFVMGFAFQAFPRIKHANLWRPDLANVSFYLMVFGVFARAIAEPLHQLAAFRALATAAGVAEIAAIALFIVVVGVTLRRSEKALEVFDYYILAALFFFIAQAMYDLGLLYATMTAAGQSALLKVVSTWQAPLRDLQIHGFAMLMILGVGLRMFPALFGFHQPGRRFSAIALGLLIVAVLSEAGGLLLMRITGNHAWAGVFYLAVLLLAGMSIALTIRWGLLAHPREADRSSKFIRAATAWLHTSMLMLVLFPLYMYVLLPRTAGLSESGAHAVQIGFSHAYYGAARHAVTVGFISLTILGMAGKVVPTLNGIDIRQLRGLWAPFVLVNLGCTLRVGLQVGTDFTAAAFPLVGVSGLLEVTGIGLWGIHLWRIMNGWRPAELPAAGRPARITADDMVGQVVECFPETLEVLLANGFAPLANPFLRRTMARAISLRMAAARLNLDIEQLLAELNNAAFGAVNGEATEDRDGPQQPGAVHGLRVLPNTRK